jgi:hypothetical protein
MNYWPGFVDALSTLVLSIVFLLSVFLVVQFYLSQEVTGKDKAIDELNAKLAQLSDMLSLEKLGKLNLDEQLTSLRAGLAAVQSDRDRIKGLYDGLAGAGADAQGRNTELNKALDSEKQVSSRALAQIEVLNQQISALRRQLAALEEALDASEKRDKESQGRIADLGQRLNVALAQRVQELSRYRSEFFGRLRGYPRGRRPFRVPVRSILRCRQSRSAARRPRRTRQGRKCADRARQADPAGNQLGNARRWPYRLAPDPEQSAVQDQLGAIRCARDLGGAISRFAWRSAAASARCGLCRIPATGCSTDGRCLQAQPPYRAEADRTLKW